MKNKKKIITLILIFFIIIAIMPMTYAGFNPDIYEPDPLTGGQIVSGVGNKIIGIIQVVGIIISVAILIVLGIKYVIGSVEEKASYKKSMIPYLVGAIMLFAASSLVQMLYDIGMGFFND